MKKNGHSPAQGRVNKSQRGNPEGLSILKKGSKTKLNSSGSSSKKSPSQKSSRSISMSSMEDSSLSLESEMDQISMASESPKKSPKKRRGPAGDSTSFLEQTPASLSQISSIMPADETTMVSSYPSPTKKRRQGITDDTMELAVQRARGEPDGADQSLRVKKSPKKKGSKKALRDIAENSGEEEEEDADSPGEVQDKENSTLMEQKATCVLAPLKQASKKLKALGGKNKESSKKFFDKTLPDETLVSKKGSQTFKEKRKERKMVKNNYALIQSAKGLWEDLRRLKLSDQKRKELCQGVYDKVQGKVKELSVVHDSARIVQCLVQYGGPEFRALIMEEIKGDVAELSKNKYGKFIVRKMLKYGSKSQRSAIILGFHGCVRKLIRHREGSDIINYAYNDYSNASQRLFLLEEFYGPAFTMFRTQSTRSLDDILTEQPDKKDMIMHNLRETLLPLIDKQILTLPMVHKIFHDFFKYADSKLQKDMTEALRESLIHMVHTREGARVAMGCVWGGSAKDRKVIVKSLKGHVIKMCKEENGHMVLLSIFDSVDDTVLVQKVLLDEIIKGVGELMNDVHGRKVLTYLLVRRDQGFFCPDITLILMQGDSNETSKKDAEIRAQELRGHVSDALLTYLTDNAIELLSNSHTSLIIPLILHHATGNTAAAMDALANTVVSSSDPSYTGAGKGAGERKLSLVEDPAAHITLKKILAGDKKLMHLGRDALFSVALLNAADDSTFKAWVASNRGCFILITLFEVENAQVTQMLISQLTPLKKYLKKMTFKGAEILQRKLDGEQGSKAKKPLEISL